MEGYKTRIVKEYSELTDRINKLKDFISLCKSGDVNIGYDYSVLERQLKVMREYAAILEVRAMFERVKLD